MAGQLHPITGVLGYTIGYFDDDGNYYDQGQNPVDQPPEDPDAGNAATNTNPPPSAPPAGGGGDKGNGVRAIPVPGGGQVVTWSEPNPNYDPNGIPGANNQPYLTHTQYVTPNNSGSTTNNVHTTERLIDPSQIAVEQMRGKNALDIANANNQRQTGADLGVIGGSPTLAAQKQQFDQFDTLSKLAANPRNFMDTFFRHRGFNPPPNAGNFSNTAPFTGGGYTLPNFLGGGAQGGGPSSSAGAASPAGGPPAGAPAPAVPGAPQVPKETPGQVSFQSPSTFGPGVDPYASLRGTPMEAGLPPASNYAASNSGVASLNLPPQGDQTMYTGGSKNFDERTGTYSPMDTSSAQRGTIMPNAPGAPAPAQSGFSYTQPWQADPNSPQAQAFRALNPAPSNAPPGAADAMGFAKGGIMSEPMLGAGMHSNPQAFAALQQAPGHKYLIGERGPEGVVPASYLPKFLQSRHGKAISAGGLGSSDALYGTNQGGMGSAYGDGGMVGVPQGASGGDAISMWGQGGPLGLPNRQIQNAMRTPLSGATMDGGATSPRWLRAA